LPGEGRNPERQRGSGGSREPSLQQPLYASYGLAIGRLKPNMFPFPISPPNQSLPQEPFKATYNLSYISIMENPLSLAF
jgi:hypothetical protein